MAGYFSQDVSRTPKGSINPCRKTFVEMLESSKHKPPSHQDGRSRSRAHMEQRNYPKGPQNCEHETASERPHLSPSGQSMASPYPDLLSFYLAGNVFVFKSSRVIFYWV